MAKDFFKHRTCLVKLAESGLFRKAGQIIVPSDMIPAMDANLVPGLLNAAHNIRQPFANNGSRKKRPIQ